MAVSIQCHGLHFSYDNLTTVLFDNLDLQLQAGWTSICGANGCGKSTLLKLIAGELTPQAGSIICRGRLTYVPQSTDSSPNNLAALATLFDSLTIRVKNMLGIEESWLERWPTLSIGERKRMQLACALSGDPDILLVDEPSNHVDQQTKQQMLQALQQFRGIGLLVSHDRTLLNELCDNTAFLKEGSLQLFHCPYNQARQALADQVQLQLNKHQQIKHALKKTKRAAQAQSEKIAQGKRALSKRHIHRKDHDAKAKVDRARVTGADKPDSRKKQLLNRQEQRLAEAAANTRPSKSYDLGVYFEPIASAKRIAIHAGELSLPYLQLAWPNLVLEPGEKLALIGPNGAGKSTLLNHWRDGFPPEHMFAPQEFSEAERATLTADILSLNTDLRGQILSLLSCFGSSPKSIVAGSAPSPGMWQKLMIAQAIVVQAPLLVLDEPTNHMDLPAIEVLEEALARYQGILVFISHDEPLVARLATKTLEIKGSQACFY